MTRRNFILSLATVCEERGVNLFDDREDWLKGCAVIANVSGEDGREAFHSIARQSSKYKYGENEKLYTQTLRKLQGGGLRTSFQTLKDMAETAGVDVASLGKVHGASGSGITVGRRKTPRKQQKAKFLPAEDVIALSENGKGMENALSSYLSGFYGKDKVRDVVATYLVGTDERGWTVYPQIDEEMRCHYAKLVKYYPTGHRVENCVGALHSRYVKADVCSICKDFKKPYYRDSLEVSCLHWHTCDKVWRGKAQYKQCLFGQHLLSLRPSESVCLCEAEKTALVCSLEYPEYVWLAVGSKQLFTQERLLPLKGRKVYVFPDVDGFVEWKQKMGKVDEEVRQARGERAGDMEAIPFARDWGLVDWRADWDKDKKNNSHRDIADLILERKRQQQEMECGKWTDKALTYEEMQNFAVNYQQITRR